MAIDNVNVVDGMAIDTEGNSLRLLLTDHLPWEKENDYDLSEYDHLMLLQDKINAYLAFCESGQYAEQYPDAEISMVIIEIHFKYEITTNCGKFLQTVQNQVEQYGIKIEAHIG